MTRRYSHRASGDQAKDRYYNSRYDRRNDPYEPIRPARRQPSVGSYRSPSSSSDSPSSRRSSSGSSRRRSSTGGFLARRSTSDSSSSRNSAHRSIHFTQRSNWEAEMDVYFDALKEDASSQQELDPIVNDRKVMYDRERRGGLHRSELVANQFDVSLPHVRDLLQHMLRKYDTVTCFSMDLIKPGSIIYYIDPFVLGFDQEIEGDAASVLGGARFQAAVQVKGRFGIVTRIVGNHTLKVAPIYTFNGEGMASKPPSVRAEYMELGRPGRFTWAWTKPNISPVIEEEFCPMKPGAAVHMVTSKVSLSSQILIAGSITAESLESLRGWIVLTEESHDW